MQKIIRTKEINMNLFIFFYLNIFMHKLTPQQSKIRIDVIKNVLTLIASLIIKDYKTYKSYLPIAVLPGSCVLALAL